LTDAGDAEGDDDHDYRDEGNGADGSDEGTDACPTVTDAFAGDGHDGTDATAEAAVGDGSVDGESDGVDDDGNNGAADADSEAAG
jgi:hypothetical protein